MNTKALRGTIEHVDPHTLVIEANVRPSGALTKEFVQSIRENGVLTPVLARRGDDGALVVRAGQRRTLAAIEAGLGAIPAYVVEADDATTERIIQQMVENDQRQALSDGDRAAAFQQLVLQGVSVATIAKRTGTHQAEVKTGLAVADNPVAASAIAAYQLTLDQAAALIEFDDNPEVREQLIEVATTDPAQFAHAAQRARDDAVRAKAKSAAESDLVERGFVIVDRDWFYDGEFTRVSDLITPEGAPVTDTDLVDVDGRAAHVRAGRDGTVQITYLVADPKAAGFKKRTPSGGTGVGPMTDEQKAERRTLIANNNAWASAETVRREWLTTFLTRKTLPKEASPFVAHALTFHRHTVGTAISGGNSLAHDLFGIEREPGYYGHDRLAEYLEAHPLKAQHITLAIVLAGIEQATSRDTWRNPTRRDADYLNRLAAWGYTLSDVERIVTDTTDRDVTVDPSDEALRDEESDRDR